MRVRKNATSEKPCNCVFRAIFRACYNRFRECSVTAEHIGAVALEFCSGREGRRMYGRKKEEYSADFWLVSRRHLDSAERKIFHYHYVLGADWKYCCRRIGMDRGTFFHMVYRMEERLGQVFADLRPYSLWPLNEYFGAAISQSFVTPSRSFAIAA